MKLSEIKNEDAIELWANLVDPISVIVLDEDVKKETTRLKQIGVALKKHKKEVITILALLDGVPVDEYECNAVTLPKTIIEVLNDEEIQDFLESLGVMTE